MNIDADHLPGNSVPASNVAKARESETRDKTPALIGVFVVMIAVLNLIVGAVMANSRPPLEIAILVFFGFLIGELYVVLVIVGLCGRSWIEGLGLGCVATIVCSSSLLFVGLGRSDFFETLALCSIFFFLPAVLLVAASPLLFCRWLWGWRLTSTPDQPPVRGRLRIEDFFTFTAVLAAVLFCSRAPLTILQPTNALFANSGWLVWSLMANLAILLVFCLVIVVPAIAIGFKGSRPFDSGLRTFLVVGLVLVCLTHLPLLWFRADGSMHFVFVTTLFAALSCGLATMIFRADGVCLIRAKRVNQSDDNANEADSNDIRLARESAESLIHPLDIIETHKAQLLARRPFWTPSRGWAAVFLVLAVVANGIAWGVSSGRMRGQRANYDTERFVAGLGGECEISGQDVLSLRVGAGTTDESMDTYLKYTKVRELSLAGSKITDATIEKLDSYPGLSSLDLSHTSITDAAISKLAKNSGLRKLSLAHTRVSPQAIAKLLRVTNYSSIDLSGCNIDDKSLQTFRLGYCTRIVLRDNRLTDEGLQDLWPNIARDATLDISGNPVTGKFLATCPLANLVLERVDVKDSDVAGYLSQRRVVSLTLSHTRVTPAILPMINACTTLENLKLGPGLIAEQDLAAQPLINVREIWLTGSSFTGESLATWKRPLRSVVLSGSAANDQSMQAMVDLRTNYLDVSQTGVTDRSLVSIGRIASQQADVRDTKVTAAGLRKWASPGSLYLIIRRTSFTWDEVRHLSDSNQFAFRSAHSSLISPR